MSGRYFIFFKSLSGWKLSYNQGIVEVNAAEGYYDLNQAYHAIHLYGSPSVVYIVVDNKNYFPLSS